MKREKFKAKYAKIVSLAAAYNEKARREGILSLSDELEDESFEDRDIFKYGIRFAIDGTDGAIIDKLLTNLVNQEKNKQKRLLKTIQKEAVLMIQQGYNVRLMMSMLNSYTDISFSENEAIINVVYKKIAAKAEVENEETPADNDTGKLNEIAELDNRCIQVIMRNLDSLVLAKALKGAGWGVREMFFRNMSERAAEMLKEDMKYMGPLRLSDVEAAQDEIIALMEKLLDSGEIIKPDSDDPVIV